MTEPASISFICTGQGGLGEHEPAVPAVIPGQDPHAALHLSCPACGREVRLGHRVLHKLTVSALDQVDISLLHF